jgi:hypothetical protein
MSHHIDTAISRKDGRLNLCDLYVFEGTERKSTVFILTVNPDAGISSPTVFHPEALYTFKIDVDGDASEDISYQINFTEPTTDGLQNFQLRRIEGTVVATETQGTVVAEGQTNAITPLIGGGHVWTGLAGDPFFANAAAFNQFVDKFLTQDMIDASVFNNVNNAFVGRNVSAVVLEVPNTALGGETIGVWGTATQVAHGVSAQITRWGTPLLTHLFLPNPQDKDAFNSGQPSDDTAHFISSIASTVAKATSLVHTSAHPEAYGERVANLLLPSILHYRPTTIASYGFAERNGRTLTDDIMGFSLTLLANQPISEYIGSVGDIQDHFPFIAPPYNVAKNLSPLNPDTRKS